MEEVAQNVSAQSAPAGLPLIHRDISWLQFNSRVLEEAEDKRNPLLERVKFLAISASNLDEFHMVRISALERRITNAQRKKEEGEERKLLAVRGKIYPAVAEFAARQMAALSALSKELERVGIHVLTDWRAVAASPNARREYEEQLLPVIPQPESFVPDKLLELGNLEAAALLPGDLWVRLPKTLPGMLMSRTAGSDLHFYFLDHLLQAFLWPPEKGANLALARLTRSADDSIDLTNSDPDFIPDAVLSGIKTREKGAPVRLELGGIFNESLPQACATAVKLAADQIFIRQSSFYLQALWTVVRSVPDEVADERKLRLPPLAPHVPKGFKSETKIFTGLRKKDYLLHHPYDSFDSYVALVRAAARDPDVVSIEQTVYRMDAVSPVITHLKEAAKTKDVRVVIELRARFDEMNNLTLAEELRKAGVKVFFGFGNLKLHAKLALITRKEEGESVRYTHFSTGNYNAATARQYTDLGLVTANVEMGNDARQLFDSLYRKEVPHAFKRLVVAPQFLARRMLAHIKEETEAAAAGKPARIFAKVNALVDDKIIEALYAASQAGVTVDLVVRGACSLVPELTGISDRIRVISIVDRFLEHSRIYYFESSKRLYLSSADWMPRNFFSRFEIAFPILDQRVFAYLENCVIPAYLGDQVKARRLNADGVWKRRTSDPEATKGVRAQVLFEDLARNGYLSTPLAV